jgi:hypothetical protein
VFEQTETSDINSIKIKEINVIENESITQSRWKIDQNNKWRFEVNYSKITINFYIKKLWV